MKNFLAVYDKILKILTRITGVIAGLLVLFTGFMIVYEVVCRSVFNAPTEWVMEIATYFLVVAGFLGMGVTYADKRHIHVDILVARLSPKTRCYIEVLTSLAGIFFSYLFMTQAWSMAMLSLEMNNCAPTTLSTPLWIPQMALPAGMGVLLLHVLRTLLADIVRLKRNDFSGEG